MRDWRFHFADAKPAAYAAPDHDPRTTPPTRDAAAIASPARPRLKLRPLRRLPTPPRLAPRRRGLQRRYAALRSETLRCAFPDRARSGADLRPVIAHDRAERSSTLLRYNSSPGCSGCANTLVALPGRLGRLPDLHLPPAPGHLLRRRPGISRAGARGSSSRRTTSIRCATTTRAGRATTSTNSKARILGLSELRRG